MRILNSVFLGIIAVSVFGQRGEIPWEADRPLFWSDFERRVGGGGYFQAYTYSGIRYTVDDANGYVRIQIECYFLEDESWVFREHATSKLLNHEQGHFDIAEIYARRMRRQLKEYEMPVWRFSSNNHMRDVKGIYNNLYDEMEGIQKQYDRDTGHGTRGGAQQEWDRWIESTLDELEGFES